MVNILLIQESKDLMSCGLGNSSSDGRHVLKSFYDEAKIIFEIASFDYVSETDRKLSGELIIQQNEVETHRLKDVVFSYTT